MLIQKWTIQGGRKHAGVVVWSFGKLLLSFTYVGGKKQKIRSPEHLKVTVVNLTLLVTRG